MRLLLSCAAVLLAAGASLASAQPAPRGPDGFANNYPHPEKESFWSWQWERMRDGLPKPPPGGWNRPAVRTDPVALGAAEANPPAATGWTSTGPTDPTLPGVPAQLSQTSSP